MVEETLCVAVAVGQVTLQLGEGASRRASGIEVFASARASPASAALDERASAPASRRSGDPPVPTLAPAAASIVVGWSCPPAPLPCDGVASIEPLHAATTMVASSPDKKANLG